jgi:hypothetical protein
MRRQLATAKSTNAEQESHAAAGRLLQRKCACGKNTGGGGDCGKCADKGKRIQRRASREGAFDASATKSVGDVLRSQGSPLDNATRSFMESRFGRDFSGVKLHTDSRAGESARAVGALAYTVGRDVVLDSAHYSPGSASGRRLLAHELTHVLQQETAAPSDSSSLEVGPPDDAFEREADAAAARVLGGGAAEVRNVSRLSVRRMQMQRAQDTHGGVFHQTRHNPIGGPTFSPDVEYDVRIEFQPYPVVDCDQIALTQSVVERNAAGVVHVSAAERDRALTASQGTEGVAIDRLSGRTFPYYGVNNTGLTGGSSHFGSRTAGSRPERAWLEDTPTSTRSPGEVTSIRFETCALCTQGTDLNAYYGCVSWGYNIDASNRFTEAPLARVSKGAPSADFLAAAGNWNAQTTPVATVDLPIPGYSTRNAHMTLAELSAEIRTLETRLAALPAGHADIPQITFDLRVLRDFRDAISYNEDQHYLQTEIMMIQQKVGAPQDGQWGYETVRRVKLWQAAHGMTADGRVGPATLERMHIYRAGDYPLPDMSEGASRPA